MMSVVTFKWFIKMKVHFFQSENEKKIKQAWQNVNFCTEVESMLLCTATFLHFSIQYFHSKKLESICLV